jgi:membrane-associated protease RseP (regulator of RpoE activity)
MELSAVLAVLGEATAHMWVAIIVHEVGHAIAAVFLGLRVTELVIGTPTVLRLNRLRVGPLLLRGSCTFDCQNPRKTAAVAMAGPFATLLAAAVAWSCGMHLAATVHLVAGALQIVPVLNSDIKNAMG